MMPDAIRRAVTLDDHRTLARCRRLALAAMQSVTPPPPPPPAVGSSLTVAEVQALAGMSPAAPAGLSPRDLTRIAALPACMREPLLAALRRIEAGPTAAARAALRLPVEPDPRV